MNNKDFIATLADRLGYTADDTQKMVDIVIEAMGDHFQEDKSVLVPNFGTFEVKKKMERIMVLNFKPNASWKELVKNGGAE